MVWCSLSKFCFKTCTGFWSRAYYVHHVWCDIWICFIPLWLSNHVLDTTWYNFISYTIHSLSMFFDCMAYTWRDNLLFCLMACLLIFEFHLMHKLCKILQCIQGAHVSSAVVSIACSVKKSVFFSFWSTFSFSQFLFFLFHFKFMFLKPYFVSWLCSCEYYSLAFCMFNCFLSNRKQ